jgi:hypothetical protein
MPFRPEVDCEKLIRPDLHPSWLNDLHPSWLNDDALARHLDRLYEAGIPFYSDVHDDNRSDKVWNPEVLSRIHEQFKQAKIDDEWIYVADSAGKMPNKPWRPSRRPFAPGFIGLRPRSKRSYA